MFIEVAIAKFRSHTGAYTDHHLSTGDRIVITRNGRPLYALVSLADFERLEKVDENREEFLEARHEERMREFRMLKGG